MDKRDSKQRFAPFLVYLILFHAFWMWGFVFWIYPWMRSLGDTTLRYALVNIAIRFLIWVLPVFLYLRHIDHVDPIEYLKLKQNWKRGVIIGIVLSLINFFGAMMRFGAPHPNTQSLTWNSVISTSFLIGFFEEIPYRGFILQKFQARFGFWIATLISALLFLSIHLPGWISLHLLKIESVISVFIFGFVLAIIFRLGKSLWGPIITHSLNDFIAFILFRI
jgi:membrane protease YdiL (CAAX protease family)